VLLERLTAENPALQAVASKEYVLRQLAKAWRGLHEVTRSPVRPGGALGLRLSPRVS